MSKLKSLAETFFNKINFNDFSKNFVDNAYNGEIKKIATKVEICDNKAIFTDPMAYHGRYSDLQYLINRVCKEYKVSDCKFIVMLTDCYATDFPAFSTIRPHQKDKYNIPIPMGNVRGLKEGWGTPIEGWDNYIKKTIKHKYSWNKKIKKAVFRGQFSMQTYALGQYGSKKAEHWTEVNRGYLYNQCKDDSDLFDIGFSKICNPELAKKIPTIEPIPFQEQQKYKYIISVGTNADWAERLRTHLFTNSLLVKHEAECVEWFYPLMLPWVDYIPFSIDMSDLTQNIMWATLNDFECEVMVENANQLAEKYLNEKTMVKFMKIVLDIYSNYQ